MLRVLVSGGGCSGFQYSFAFDDTRNDDDLVFSHAGIDVVIDEMSLELLEGAEIDFVEDLAGAAFRIDNPNATAFLRLWLVFRRLNENRKLERQLDQSPPACRDRLVRGGRPGCLGTSGGQMHRRFFPACRNRGSGIFGR